MQILILLAITSLKFIYFFMKLLPTKKRIVLISRLSDKKLLDFTLLEKDLKATLPEYEIIVLCKKLEKSFVSHLKYSFHILKQMYFLATSEIAILDSYCIPVGILKHKSNIKIIQIWHALGSFKKFGYSILDLPEGSKSNVANLMKMHKNYDYVLCSGIIPMVDFEEAFNTSISKIHISLLPHVNYLKKNKNIIIKNIFDLYPKLNNGKKNILYAPTFRKDKRNYFASVYKKINYKKYNLIIKSHAGKERIYIDGKLVYSQQNKFGFEILCVTDYAITDYSAIMYDCVLLNIPLYFYIPDFEKYKKERGFYFNYEKYIPGIFSKNIDIILKNIYSNKFDKSNYLRIKKDYVDEKAISISDFTAKIIKGEIL